MHGLATCSDARSWHCRLGSAGVRPLRHKFVFLDSIEQSGFSTAVTCASVV